MIRNFLKGKKSYIVAIGILLDALFRGIEGGEGWMSILEQVWEVRLQILQAFGLAALRAGYKR